MIFNSQQATRQTKAATKNKGTQPSPPKADNADVDASGSGATVGW
jgi:hypothetical protein